MRDTEYIIVGDGYAALFFAHQLLKENKDFVIFSEGKKSASQISAGMINPVVLKRFTSFWLAKEQIDFLHKTLSEIQQYTGKNYLINKSKKFIYSTALPPVNNLWNLFILENLVNIQTRIEKFQELVTFSLNILKKLNLKTKSTSHIISIIIGDNLNTVNLSNNLKELGYLAYAIKEPTVPKDTARLRISLTADMKKEDIETFFKALKSEMKKIGVI